MPGFHTFPPDQARAIAINYRKHGKPIPAKVAEELRLSLKGVPCPQCQHGHEHHGGYAGRTFHNGD